MIESMKETLLIWKKWIQVNRKKILNQDKGTRFQLITEQYRLIGRLNSRGEKRCLMIPKNAKTIELSPPISAQLYRYARRTI